MNNIYKKALILNETPLTNETITTIIKDAKNYHIHLLSFSKHLDENELIELTKRYNFKTFNIHFMKTKMLDEIKKQLKEVPVNSIILFVGLEKIFLDTSNQKIQIKDSKKTFNYHSYENISSQKIISFINKVFEEHSLHFLFLTQSDKKSTERITSDLEKYDLEISCIRYEESDDANDKDIFNIINTSSYEDSIKILNSLKNNYSEQSIRELQVMIYLQHGFNSDAIKFLKDNFDIISNDEKKKLADLYYFDNKYHESFIISYSIFKEDPFIIGLNTLILKCSIKQNNFVNYYEEILQFDNKDMKVLTICADYFTQNNLYNKAIEFREKIFNITNDPIELLLIEILKIEISKPLNGHIAENQILKKLKSYKSENLDIEISFRLGKIWFEIYNSPYMAYKHFKDVLITCHNMYSVDAAKYRMTILSNHGYSSKIIKNSHQLKYPDKLPNMRINELLNSILILTFNDKGYITWQNFIDKSQTNYIWKKYLSIRCIKELKDIDKLLIINKTKKSVLFNDLKESELINILRNLKGQPLSQENIEELKNSSNNLIAAASNNIEQIWIRYYLINHFITFGEMQLANNHSISLWHLANRLENNKEKKIARLLGTLSWGIAQFKNGKEIESIACILVTLKHFIEIEEIIPLLEDSLGVINSWVHNNKDYISKEDLDFFIDFFKKSTPNNAKQDEIYELLAKEDWTTIHSKLGYKVYNTTEYDSQWALDFYHFILASLNIDKKEITLNLILKDVDNLVIALSTRIDIRAKIIYKISEILFIHLNNPNTTKTRMKTAQKLLNIAINDLEKKRNDLKNVYERSFISDDTRMIYKLFLTINITLFKTKIFDTEDEELELIENSFKGFDYLSIRTIKERKDNNNTKEISPELEKIEEEYSELVEELSQFSIRNFKKAYESNDYKEKSDRYLKLRKKLELEHPDFKNDTYYEYIPLNMIQSKLEKDEIYYQYVDTDLFICYFIITKDNIDFGIIKDEVKSEINLEKLAKDIQEFHIHSTYDLKVIENSYEELSNKYFIPLKNYLNKYKKIFINHDLSLPLISSNLIRFDDNWIIENVDFIINLVNRNYFINRKKNIVSDFNISVIGKKTDNQIKETNKWIESKYKEYSIDEIEKKFNSIAKMLSENKINSLLIVSHGTQGSTQNNLTGSLSIEGSLKTYTIDDLKFIENLNTVVLLTCSSGLTSIGEYETNNSIISNILSKNINNILLCKWDVFLTPSLEIFDNILQNNDEGIEFLLQKSIKKTINEKNWQHPVYWAGIEVWRS